MATLDTAIKWRRAMDPKREARCTRGYGYVKQYWMALAAMNGQRIDAKVVWDRLYGQTPTYFQKSVMAHSWIELNLQMRWAVAREVRAIRRLLRPVV